jgi:acyl carrier protein
VRRVVAEAAAKVCGCPPEHIREDQTLRCQLGMGGLDQLEFVLAVEEQLGIPPMEAASIVTIGDVVKAAAAAGLR